MTEVIVGGRDDDLVPGAEAAVSGAPGGFTGRRCARTGRRRVACLCCSTACPAQSIAIQADEYPEGDPRRGCERFPATFVIDELRCVFCGFVSRRARCDAVLTDTGIHHALRLARAVHLRKG